MSVSLESAQNHPKAAVWHDGALQGRLCLKPNDDFVLLINVAGAMRRNRAGNLRDVEHSFLALFDKQLVQTIPDLPGPLRRGRKKRLISLIWLVVLLNEITDVDFLLPKTRLESVPGRNRCFRSSLA